MTVGYAFTESVEENEMQLNGKEIPVRLEKIKHLDWKFQLEWK